MSGVGSWSDWLSLLSAYAHFSYRGAFLPPTGKTEKGQFSVRRNVGAMWQQCCTHVALAPDERYGFDWAQNVLSGSLAPAGALP